MPRIMLDKKEKRIESPRFSPLSVRGTGTTSDMLRPITVAITETIKPAIGPDAPISISDFLVAIGDFILINAPNVPIMFRAGMKYGSVAFTLCFLDAK